jgi:branched-chain amino acid transport system substrate-binding protein
VRHDWRGPCSRDGHTLAILGRFTPDVSFISLWDRFLAMALDLGRCNLGRGIFKSSARIGFLAAFVSLGWGCQTTPDGQSNGANPPKLTQKPSSAVSSTARANPAPIAATAISPARPATPSPGKINLLAPQADPERMVPEVVERRVALLIPLSGRGASIGRALLESTQLALFETAGDDLELLVFDTQGTIAGAEDAARLAVADGAGLILGPLFGASAQAVRPVASAAGISAVSFSNNRDIAGDGIYVFGFLPDQQVRRILAYAAGQGHGDLGALVPSSGFGELVVATARIAAEQEGMNVVRATYYGPSDTELSALIRQFADYDSRKSTLAAQKSVLSRRTDQISRRALERLSGLETLGDPPFDSVLLPAGDPELRGIAPLLAYYDVDPARVRLLGTALWDEARGLGAEPALVGGWYAAPAPEARLVFEDKFEQAFGRKPPRLASLGYDAMLLAVALTYGEKGADYTSAALTDTNGFAGVDGIFRLLADGTNQRGLAVLEVREREVLVIDPAPDSFTDLQF